MKSATIAEKEHSVDIKTCLNCFGLKIKKQPDGSLAVYCKYGQFEGLIPYPQKASFWKKQAKQCEAYDDVEFN